MKDKDLFSIASENETNHYMPLAARMRPQKLSEFAGQRDVLGPGKFLRRMIENDTVPSLLLFGPPGVGKTTLAQIIAASTHSEFARLNAVSSGIADIRKTVEQAKERLRFYRKRTIVFIDEIHRFNKAQQDSLLPYVEEGSIILIGATTENPYFEVNSPLLSRMRVVRLQPLERNDIVDLLKQALVDCERGLGSLNIQWHEEALLQIFHISGGDARISLNILEQCVAMVDTDKSILTKEMVATVAGDNIQIYDKNGDQHYDVVSAFIKSMRGSDVNAALHYLARMIAGGEDVRFIARRIVICAAEDVGLADPQALVIATTAAQAVQFVGFPEARIILAEAVVYIATAEKSNSAYVAIDEALVDVRQKQCGPVPIHLRDSSYANANQLGHGKGYLYPHDYPESQVIQQYMPDSLLGSQYYHPTKNGYEAAVTEKIKRRLNSNC